MRLFNCDHCGQVVYFDSHHCVRCGHRLGYDPQRAKIHAIESNGDLCGRLGAEPQSQVKLCANATLDVCNWLIDLNDTDDFCIACRHNRLIPSTQTPEGVGRWGRISQAQRHLFYSILRWNLPHSDRKQDPDGGLVFDFLEDDVFPDGTVVPAMSGHDEGLIAIRAAEADDATREQARESMHELYRTLLGHLRHQIGHFIWNKLVRDRDRLQGFRAPCGDEQEDYGVAVQRYYANGPVPGWQDSFISADASSHPWEDFAECFAHYLHIVDSLETASSFGMVINPRGIRKWQRLSTSMPMRRAAPSNS